MATYSIKFTDVNVTPIIINQGDLNVDATSVALFGRINLEYGDLLNENLLHLLEHFTCPEDPEDPNTPDLTVALYNTLENPTVGGIWFNSTQKSPFIWDGTEWQPLGSTADYGANSGQIYHGQQLPLPVSASGYEFSYNECVWVVSPSGIDLTGELNPGFSYMVCTTDANGVVNHTYSVNVTNGPPTPPVLGIANYIIIGIRSNVNIGEYIPPPAPPAPPAPVTPTPTTTPSAGATVTPTSSLTLTPTVTLSITPSLTVTPTPTRAPSVTPSATRIPPISATIFMDPSVGLQQAFGASEANLSNVVYTTLDPAKKSLGIWVANLSGGNGGPYTISWNLNLFYTAIQNYVQVATGSPPLQSAPCALAPLTLFPNSGSSFNGNPSGYSCTIGGTTTGVTAGNGLKANALCRVNFNLAVTGNFNFSINTRNITINVTMLAGSNIRISDSSGNSTTYFTPGGSEGNVSGTQLLSSPGTNYTDSYQAVPFSVIGQIG